MAADSKDKDDEILKTLRKRYAACVERWSSNYDKARADIKFAAASPDDPWQWEDDARARRKTEGRPMMTLNVMPQHVRQVTNDARQNRPAIKVRPVDDKADIDTAEVFNGVIRHIQANSRANMAYNTGLDYAVTGGIGYWRIITDYRESDSFNQDIYIDRIANPFTVWPDPDCQLPDASDAKFWFVADEVDKKEFEKLYPDAGAYDFDILDVEERNWCTKDTVRIAEYWCFKPKKRTLLLMADNSSIYLDELPEEMQEGAKGAAVKSREVEEREVCWYKTNGIEILERTEWAGRYMPFVRVVGNEYNIDGEFYYSGIVRNAKDAQRAFNFAISANTEHVSLRTKTPWLAAYGAIEGFEDEWTNANTSNRSVLFWNGVDDAGNPLPQPSRVEPPEASQGWLTVMQTAADQIKQTTGQYDASLGQRSNETSGKAILARQREGDTGTFHFMDNQALAIEQTGKILVDLIPKIIDTQQIVRILGEDGTPDHAQITGDDPNAPAKRDEDDGQGGIRSIYNLGVGKYDVDISVGPSFNTKRQEGADFLTTLVQSAPDLLPIMGDLLFKIMDTPYADDIAKRFKAMAPPQIQALDNEGKAPDPQVVQMQDQLKQADEYIKKLEGAFQAQHDQMESNQQEADDKLVIARMQEDTKRMVADQNNEAKKDVEEIKGMVSILLAQLGPPADAYVNAEYAERSQEDASGGSQLPLTDSQPQPAPQEPASAGFLMGDQQQPAPQEQPQQGGFPG